jgi:biotin operon repressor
LDSPNRKRHALRNRGNDRDSLGRVDVSALGEVGGMSLPGFDKVPGLTPEAAALIGAFKEIIEHHTPDTPIVSASLEQMLDLPGTAIRAIVSQLRTEGYPVGSSGDGYFIARTADELASTRDHIEGRIARLNRVDDGLKIAQARLRCGQKIGTQSSLFEGR